MESLDLEDGTKPLMTAAAADDLCVCVRVCVRGCKSKAKSQEPRPPRSNTREQEAKTTGPAGKRSSKGKRHFPPNHVKSFQN